MAEDQTKEPSPVIRRMQEQLERLKAGGKPTLAPEAADWQQPMMYVPAPGADENISRHYARPQEVAGHGRKSAEPAAPKETPPLLQFRFPLPAKTPGGAETPATLTMQTPPHLRGHYRPREFHYLNRISLGNLGHSMTTEEYDWLQNYLKRRGIPGAWEIGQNNPPAELDEYGYYQDEIVQFTHGLFDPEGDDEESKAYDLLLKTDDADEAKAQIAQELVEIGNRAAAHAYYGSNEGEYDQGTLEYETLQSVAARQSPPDIAVIAENLRALGDEVGSYQATQDAEDGEVEDDLAEDNPTMGSWDYLVDNFIDAQAGYYADRYPLAEQEFYRQVREQRRALRQAFNDGYKTGYMAVADGADGVDWDDYEEAVTDLIRELAEDADLRSNPPPVQDSDGEGADPDYAARQQEIERAKAAMRDDDGDHLPHGRYEYDGETLVRVGETEPLTVYHGTVRPAGDVISELKPEAAHFDSAYRQTIGRTPAIYATTRSHALRYASGHTSAYEADSEPQLYELTMTPSEIVDLGNCQYDGAAKAAIEAGADVIVCPEFWEQPETVAINPDVVHISRGHKLKAELDVDYGSVSLREGAPLPVPPTGRTYPKAQPQLRYQGSPTPVMPDADARLGQRPRRRAKGKQPAGAAPRRMMMRHSRT